MKTGQKYHALWAKCCFHRRMAPTRTKNSGRSTAKSKGKRKDNKGESCASSTTDGSVQGAKGTEDPADLRRHVQKAYREAHANEGNARSGLM